MGPFRWNLSKRGVGVSGGIPGFRIGVSADGRRYVSIGIPGTGLYYFRYLGDRRRSGGGSAPTLPNPAPQNSISFTPSIPIPALPSASQTIVAPKPPVAKLNGKRSGVVTGESFEIMERAVVGKTVASSDGIDINLSCWPEASLIAAQHAEIRFDAIRGWIIRDLGSKSGSFIRHAGARDFQRVVGEAVLNNYDEVSFGNAQFEFRCA